MHSGGGVTHTRCWLPIIMCVFLFSGVFSLKLYFFIFFCLCFHSWSFGTNTSVSISSFNDQNQTCSVKVLVQMLPCLDSPELIKCLLCVIDLNPCWTNPCLNGGMCTLDRGDFMCLCPPQYHGKTCESGNQHLRLTSSIPETDVY